MATRSTDVIFNAEIEFARLTTQSMDNGPMHSRVGGQFNCRAIFDKASLQALVDAGLQVTARGYPIVTERGDGRFQMKLKRNNIHKVEKWGGAPEIVDLRGTSTKPWAEKTQIGNGSLAKVKINVWVSPRGEAFTRLEKIGILTLVAPVLLKSPKPQAHVATTTLVVDPSAGVVSHELDW